MEWLKDWLPLITSGLMLAFGAAIWAMVKGILKTFNSFLNAKAPKLDFWSEKYMGDESSDEMWRNIRSVGESLVRVSNEMIARDSFQKNNSPEPTEPPGPVTDLSGELSKGE